MPIEPIKIPQNVQIEDHIIGPVSLRQIILCMIGGAISFSFWNALKAAGYNTHIHMAIGWSPFAIAAAFAFLKVQNLSLLRIILLLVERMKKPMKRSFAPRTGVSVNIKAFYKTQTPNVRVHTNQSTVGSDRLKQLGTLLDDNVGEYVDEDDSIELNEEEEEKPTPVKKDRIAVDTQEHPASVDGIQSQKTVPTLRDLSGSK